VPAGAGVGDASMVVTGEHQAQRARVVFLHDADVLPGPVGALEELGRQTDLDVPRHPGFGVDDELAQDFDSVSDLAMYHLERLLARSGRGSLRGVHVMGAGFGGWVALEMAVRRQDFLASLTLISPYGVKVSDRLTAEFADILLLDPEELIELGWADPARVAWLRMPGYPADLDDEADARAFSNRAALARFGWNPFMYDPRLKRWLSVLDLPTLVLAGRRDRMLAAGHSRQVAKLIPGARYVEIDDAGHYPYIETPEAFLTIVTSFIHDADGKGVAG
jgi:pimeloyl-ACP methyl ester carboxylesterase